MNPSEDLLAEHEGVMRVLDILEKICNQFPASPSLPLAHLESILEFLKVFVDKCHHGKEEDFLFPALSVVGTASQVDIIDHLLKEHARGRSLVGAMADAKERLNTAPDAAGEELTPSALSYIELMRHHIKSENEKLFPLIDGLLTKNQQAWLLEQFEQVESQRIGAGRHEAFHKMIHDLSHVYLA